MALILALNPGNSHTPTLARLARELKGVELIGADSCPTAIKAIKERVPDLVLLPAKTAPGEADLIAQLKRIPGGVLTVTLPPVEEADPVDIARQIREILTGSMAPDGEAISAVSVPAPPIGASPQLIAAAKAAIGWIQVRRAQWAEPVEAYAADAPYATHEPHEPEPEYYEPIPLSEEPEQIIVGRETYAPEPDEPEGPSVIARAAETAADVGGRVVSWLPKVAALVVVLGAAAALVAYWPRISGAIGGAVQQLDMPDEPAQPAPTAEPSVPAPTTQPAAEPFRGRLVPGLNFVGPPTLTYNADIETKSAYVLDTVKLSEQWYVNGGVRYDHFERDQRGPAAANNASREDDLVNWHAGIVYKPIPIASIYAAVATSSNPIGAELDSTGVQYGGLSVGTSVLSPEKAIGYEVGTKWELFDKRLLATAALFHTDKWNARENTSACDNVTLVCVAADTGAYRVRGLELGAQGNINKWWMIYGGFVWMDTEVTESAVAANVGRRVANIPERQFNLLSKYKLTDALTIGGQAVYSTEVYAGHLAAANNGYHTVPFWRFDALAEYKFSQSLSMQLNVVNIFDTVYYDALYQSDGANAFVAPGRAGYLTVNWKY